MHRPRQPGPLARPVQRLPPSAAVHPRMAIHDRDLSSFSLAMIIGGAVRAEQVRTGGPSLPENGLAGDEDFEINLQPDARAQVAPSAPTSVHSFRLALASQGETCETSHRHSRHNIRTFYRFCFSFRAVEARWRGPDGRVAETRTRRLFLPRTERFGASAQLRRDPD